MLGVPLHADIESPAARLDSFDEAVRTARGDVKAVRRVLDRLVVEAVHPVARRAGERTNQAVGNNRDLVRRLGTGERLLVIRDVEVQAAAERDRHCLYAAADAERRQVILVCAARQRELIRVALGRRLADKARVVVIHAEPFGLDVAAAAEQQSVD